MDQFFLVIYIVGAGLGILIIPALLIRKNNSFSNRILSGLILLIVSNLVIAYLSQRMVNDSYFLYLLDGSLGLLFGPLLFFYTRELITSKKKLSSRDLLHFIPAVLLTLWGGYFFISPAADRALYMEQVSQGNYAPEDAVSTLLVLLQIAAYSLASTILLYRYSAKIKTFFSDIKKLQLIWLRILIAVFLISSTLGLISALVFSFNYPSLANILWRTPNILLTILLYITCFFAVSQPGIFKDLKLMNETLVPPELTGNNKSPEEKDRVKYEKNRLDEKTIEKYLAKIETFMEEEQCYKDPELNLRKLSNQTEIPSHLISQVLNTQRNENFFYFVNSYRVEEAKRELSDRTKNNLSILEIAFEVGFNSKSTFNAAFKKYTNVTPTEFRKREQGISSSSQ